MPFFLSFFNFWFSIKFPTAITRFNACICGMRGGSIEEMNVMSRNIFDPSFSHSYSYLVVVMFVFRNKEYTISF